MRCSHRNIRHEVARRTARSTKYHLSRTAANIGKQQILIAKIIRRAQKRQRRLTLARNHRKLKADFTQARHEYVRIARIAARARSKRDHAVDRAIGRTCINNLAVLSDLGNRAINRLGQKFTRRIDPFAQIRDGALAGHLSCARRIHIRNEQTARHCSNIDCSNPHATHLSARPSVLPSL